MRHFIYSIHSFECELRITDYEYTALVQQLYEAAKNNFSIQPAENGHRVFKYRQLGLHIYIYKNCYHYQSVRITINPQTLLRTDNTYDIFDPTENSIYAVFDKVNEMLSFMGNLYRIENFCLCRIDLCVNLNCKDDPTVEEYIRLSKKGFHLRGYSNKSISLTRSGKSKKIHHKFSFDIENQQGKQITLYNKYRQLLDIGIDSAEALEAYGTLRIEIKLSGIWLIKYLRQYGFTENNVSPELISAFISHSQEIIHQHIQKICCAGTHYKLEDTIKRIKNSSLKENYKIS